MSERQPAWVPADRRANWRAFVVIFGLLAAVYGLWLLTFWPGILGEDSFSILRQVEQPGVFTSSKPAFWYGFVAAFYRGTQRVEVPIAVQFVFSAIVFARILSWQWAQRLRMVFFVSLLAICAAPQVVFYLGSLNADGIFSAAVTGLLFELWLAARRRRVSGAALVMIALTLPVAVFARSNGLLFLAPIALLLPLLHGTSRYGLAAVTLAWCGVVAVGTRVHHDKSQGVLFPLAVFETVNFLQPRPMNLWMLEPPISARTIEVLAAHRPLSNYLAFYDPDYWDSLVFLADGPEVGSMSEQSQHVVVQEFFRYNLWHNIPDFMGSRVNVFLAAATARGGIVSYIYARPVLARLNTRSEFRRFRLDTAERWLTAGYELSFRHRWLLWSPLPGIALLLWVLGVGVRSRNVPNLLVTLTMVLQLGAIFVFSIAAEYRYLLPFYLLPLVLLPMLVLARAEDGARHHPEPQSR